MVNLYSIVIVDTENCVHLVPPRHEREHCDKEGKSFASSKSEVCQGCVYERALLDVVCSCKERGLPRRKGGRHGQR